MNRGEVLDLAKEYVTKERAQEHGDLEQNFDRIADLWNSYLEGSYIGVKDVAVMMTLLKLARIRSNPENIDNWVDAAGYMACGGELATKEDNAQI